LESVFEQLCDVQSEIETSAENAQKYEFRQGFEDNYCRIKAAM